MNFCKIINKRGIAKANSETQQTFKKSGYSIH